MAKVGPAGMVLKPWILEAVPLIVVVLIVAHLLALISHREAAVSTTSSKSALETSLSSYNSFLSAPSLPSNIHRLGSYELPMKTKSVSTAFETKPSPTKLESALCCDHVSSPSCLLRFRTSEIPNYLCHA
ncbi:hypothetical protein AKJ16_DCAP25501 [Drosera capensis]